MNLLSFDVEDWFHVERLRHLVPRATWEAQEQRVEAVVDRLLEVLAEGGARATFFVLGWVAERHPGLVRRLAAGGHEVACHGYAHEPLPLLGPARFAADLQRARAVLEDLAGGPVLGFRAPTFSMVGWALPILRAQGFLYDSSYFPGAYGHAAELAGRPGHGLIGDLGDGLWEVEIPSVPVGRRALPWGGSGYFRLCPYPLFRLGVRRIVRARGQFVFYLHPWELDPGQPRVAALAWRDRFRQYQGLHRTAGKLRRLVREFSFEPIADSVRRLAAARGEVAA
jgi:polysaccharide deacetylase family protein (PEP-CTERM system associated)